MAVLGRLRPHFKFRGLPIPESKLKASLGYVVRPIYKIKSKKSDRDTAQW